MKHIILLWLLFFTYEVFAAELRSPDDGFGGLKWGDSINRLSDATYAQSVTEEVQQLYPNIMCYTNRSDWQKMQSALIKKQEFRTNFYCFKHEHFIVGVKRSNSHLMYDAMYRWLSSFGQPVIINENDSAFYKWIFKTSNINFISSLCLVKGVMSWMISNEDEVKKNATLDEAINNSVGAHN